MKHALLKWAGMVMLLIFGIVLLQSCTKDETEPKSKFEIVFNNETIDFTKVDSITASFAKIGQAANFTRTLTKGIGSNSYYLNQSEVKEGTWDATIQVYTTEDQGSRRKYLLKKQFASLSTSHIAPIIKSDNEWTPYVILVNIPNKVEFIMPERQDQSTFNLTISGDKTWNYLYVERSSYLAGQPVAVKEWKISELIPAKLANSTAFFEYTESLKTQSWSTTEILINLKSIGTGQDCYLYYTYVNRYKL